MSDGPPASPQGSLADRLNFLFTKVRRPDRREYTNREVADGITKQGTRMSSSYVHALRSGDKINPTVEPLQALARFFGVPVGFFFDDQTATEVVEQLDHLGSMQDLKAALEDEGVRVLALKARGLSPKGIKYIEQILDYVRELEQGGGQTPPP